MGRQRRQDIPNGWHHVMNRGAGRVPIFHTRGDARRFVHHLGDSARVHGVDVVAYCLMTNHYHLLVRCEHGGLSAMMHDIGFKYVRYFNDRVGRDGPLFRSRFTSVLARTWDHRVCAARYIHRNAMDLHRPEPIGDYRWSSYRCFLGRSDPPSWLDVRALLRFFGNDHDVYRASVEGDSDTPRDATTLLGLAEVMVDEHLDLCGAPRRSMIRTIGAILLSEAEGEDHTRLAETMGFSSRDAERAAIKRARERLAHDRSVAAVFERLRAA